MKNNKYNERPLTKVKLITVIVGFMIYTEVNYVKTTEQRKGTEK